MLALYDFETGGFKLCGTYARKHLEGTLTAAPVYSDGFGTQVKLASWLLTADELDVDLAVAVVRELDVQPAPAAHVIPIE